MEKLELPIISGISPKEKQLSMDDYLRFVQFNLKYTCDLDASRQQKKCWQ